MSILFVYSNVHSIYIRHRYDPYALKCKEHFVVFIPFVLLVMVQRVILYASKNRNEEKKQMSGVLIVALIPLIVCTVQLSVNEYTSKFNQNRWLNHAEKRIHMVDDLLQNIN